jgi:hypothetical protein
MYLCARVRLHAGVHGGGFGYAHMCVHVGTAHTVGFFEAPQHIVEHRLYHNLMHYGWQDSRSKSHVLTPTSVLKLCDRKPFTQLCYILCQNATCEMNIATSGSVRKVRIRSYCCCCCCCSCRWGETVSLSCGQHWAYCSSPRSGVLKLFSWHTGICDLTHSVYHQ